MGLKKRILVQEIANYYNPFKFFFYLHNLHKNNKLNSSEIIKYWVSNVASNLVENQLGINTVSPEQMLYLTLLHYAGVSIKISAIIILFL